MGEEEEEKDAAAAVNGGNSSKESVATAGDEAGEGPIEEGEKAAILASFIHQCYGDSGMKPLDGLEWRFVVNSNCTVTVITSLKKANTSVNDTEQTEEEWTKEAGGS